MALNDAQWSYCRHCHRDEEVADGLLIEHDGYDGRQCDGSGTRPTAPPPEGTVNALTVSLKPPPWTAPQRAAAQPPAPGPWRWPWRRHVIP